MTTKEQLKHKEKEVNDLLKWITNISKSLMEEPLTLGDIVAEEESLVNRCQELQDALKEIISLRQWLDFEDINGQNSVF